jgi:hypothetical protein
MRDKVTSIDGLLDSTPASLRIEAALHSGRRGRMSRQ